MTAPGFRIFLYPGSVYCCLESAVITTILGSCVSVCLWDRQSKAGGMNHFQMPKWTGTGEGDWRYGDLAITQLIDEMKELGSSPATMAAKLFGGASVFGPVGGGVGSANIEAAQEALKRNGIPVTSMSTGGSTGVSLRFYTATGKVHLRKVERLKPL